MSVDTFGQRLKAVRESRKLTQAELGVAVKLDRKVISSYELGKSVPSYWGLLDLAVGLNTSLDYLCGLVEEQRELAMVSGPVCTLDVQAEIPVAEPWRFIPGRIS
jgi:transcriptional regulator with XRE-family HTH domain